MLCTPQHRSATLLSASPRTAGPWQDPPGPSHYILLGLVISVLVAINRRANYVISGHSALDKLAGGGEGEGDHPAGMRQCVLAGQPAASQRPACSEPLPGSLGICVRNVRSAP